VPYIQSSHHITSHIWYSTLQAVECFRKLRFALSLNEHFEANVPGVGRFSSQRKVEEGGMQQR
jgi:hypothetical protein